MPYSSLIMNLENLQEEVHVSFSSNAHLESLALLHRPDVNVNLVVITNFLGNQVMTSQTIIYRPYGSLIKLFVTTRKVNCAFNYKSEVKVKVFLGWQVKACTTVIYNSIILQHKKLVQFPSTCSLHYCT